MNELRIFENPDFGEVRTVIIGGKVYFAGVDIARALGYSNTRDAISRHCKHVVKHDGVIQTTNQYGASSTQIVEMSYIPEGDVYRLIVRSQLPDAEKFESWVFDEVLPELRNSGKYEINQKPDSYAIEDKVERAKRWIEEQEESRKEKQVLEDRVAVLEPDASAFQALCDSKLLTNFRDGAKELGMSQSQFIGWLKHEKYIYSTSKGELRPMEAYRKSDLFRMKSYTNPNNGFAGIQTYLTPKGLQYFKMQFEARGIIPEALPKHGGRNGRRRHQKSI